MMLSLRNFGLTQPNSRRKRAEGTGSEVLQSNTQRWDDLGFEHVGRMVPPLQLREITPKRPRQRYYINTPWYCTQLHSVYVITYNTHFRYDTYTSE